VDKIFIILLHYVLMVDKEFSVQLIVKKANIKEVTKVVKGLLGSYISKNPKIKHIPIKMDALKGELIVIGVAHEQLEEYLEKARRETEAKEKWNMRYEITELIEVEDTTKEENLVSEAEEDKYIEEEAIVINKPAESMYKLLLTEEAMKKLSEIPESSKNEIKKILRNLASGRWHEWKSEDMPGFTAWIENEGDRELFTLYFSKLKSLLIWGRAWSIDLLSNIKYPTGIYSDNKSLASHFLPHIIIHTIRENVDPPSFKFIFDNINYIENSDHNSHKNFLKIDPHEQLAYGKELYLLSTSRINDLIRGVQRGLPLHMSEEQINALNCEGPILISGEAGSGKTIIVTQWLMINHLQYQVLEHTSKSISQLFVTFSSRLRDHAKKSFTTMLPPVHQSHNTIFLTYQDLLEEVSRESGILNQFPKEKEMTFEKFIKEFTTSLHSKNIDPVLLWDEIRSVIKGSIIAETQPFLDLPTYQKLSDTRGQCKTPPEYRENYYSAAQDYQNYLSKNGFWDKLDMCKACLPHMDAVTKYDKIACDEVQDLAPIEIMFVTHLIKNRDLSNLLFTGDQAQVINPSGFRWNQVKGLLGRENQDKKIPDVYVLRRNYRSCLEIVDLVNAVLSIRRDILDDPVSKLNQEPLVPSRILPMVLRVRKEDLINKLAEVESNPDIRLILVKTSEEKESIKHLLEERLGALIENYTVLTIEEAKGLEYEGVLLWNFFIPRYPSITKNDWEGIFISQRREKLKEEIRTGLLNPYALTYEFNLLHVGLTRARRLLFIFDENEKMTLPLLGEPIPKKISRGDLKDFSINWKTRTATGEDYFRAGERLLERDTEQANHFFKLAASVYEKQSKFIEAAKCMEHAQDFKSAATLYKGAGDKPNELRAMGEYYKVLEQWDKSGQYFEELAETYLSMGLKEEASKSFIKAQQSYKKLDNKRKTAEMAVNSAESLPEDMHFSKAILFNKAISFVKECNDIDYTISIQEKAIREAKEAQRNGTNNILNMPINEWIAYQHLNLSNFFVKKGDIIMASSSAMKATGLSKSFMESEEYRSLPEFQKSEYEQFYIKALLSTVELYIKSDEITKAVKYQEELLSILRPKAENILIEKHWKNFAKLYLDQHEYEIYGETILELSSILVERKQHNSAITSIKMAIEECRSLNLFEISIKLLNNLTKITSENKEWEEFASAQELYGNIYKTKGDFIAAGDHFKEAGRGFLKAENIGNAEHLFIMAKESYSKVFNSTEVGWYCFYGVAIGEYLAFQGKHYGNILKWVVDSIPYFTQDFDKSLEKINVLLKDVSNEIDRHTQKYEITQSISRKKELEETLIKETELRAWIETCLAYLYKEFAQMSRNDSLINKADKWMEEAQLSFEKTNNTNTKKLIVKEYNNTSPHL